MKEMIGGCCVCSDESGWDENPLVYCDGEGCNVAVHQACYGIVSVPPGPWFCRKCESQERTARVRCELCPGRGGALKRTDTGGWAHVVCALYIPEVRFGDVSTMEPILVSIVPPDRFNKVCCLCELQGRASRSGLGACMSCNKAGCRQSFHVTCAQGSGLLCEEQVQSMNNVTYCGYCPHHYAKLQKRGHSVKPIPAFRPSSVGGGPVATPDSSPEKQPLRSSGAAAGVVEPRRHKRVRSSRSPRSAGGSASEAELAVTTSNDAWTDARVKSEASPPPPTNGNGDDANKFTTANFTETVVQPSGSVFGRTTDDASAPGGGAESESTLSTTSDVDAKPADRCPSAPGLLVIKQEPAGVDATIGGAIPSITAPSIPVAVSLTTHPPRSSPGVAPAVLLPPASSVGVEMNLSHTLVGQQPAHVASAPPTPAAAVTAVPDAVVGQLPTPQVSPRLLVLTPAAAVPVVGGGAIFSEVPQSAAAVVASVQPSAAASAAVSQLSASSAAPMPSAIAVPTAVGNKGKRPRVAGAGAGETRKRKPPGRPRKHLSAAGLDEDAVTDLTTSTAGSADHMLDTSNSASVYTAAARNSGGGGVVRGQNGAVSSYTMLGNQLNPSSAMAQQLGDSLAAEIEDQGDQQLPGSTAGAAQQPTALVGPPLPGGARFAQSRGMAGGVGTFPQSLSELLERQWEQGSQFLMEQAQHFDISALLSCLYQLRRENDQLEDHMSTLSQRRDHLLAVHARLSVPLEGITASSTGHPPVSAAPARPASGPAAPPAPPQPSAASRHVQQLVSPRNLAAGGGMENGVLPPDHPLHVHPHPHQQQQQHHLQQQQQMVHGVGGRLLNRTSPSSSQSAGVRDRIAAASAVRTTSSLSYMSTGAVGGNNAMAVPLIVNTSSALQQHHHHHQQQQQQHHHHSLQQSAAVGARVMAHPADHRDHRLMESLRVSAGDATGVGAVYPQYQMVSPPTPAVSLHHVVHMPPPPPAPGSLPPAGHQSHPLQQHRHRLDKR